MRRLDVFGAFEIGDRAADFEDAAVGARKLKLLINVNGTYRLSATL
jgi:hypothetical protein